MRRAGRGARRQTADYRLRTAKADEARATLRRGWRGTTVGFGAADSEPARARLPHCGDRDSPRRSAPPTFGSRSPLRGGVRVNAAKFPGRTCGCRRASRSGAPVPDPGRKLGWRPAITPRRQPERGNSVALGQPGARGSPSRDPPPTLKIAATPIDSAQGLRERASHTADLRSPYSSLRPQPSALLLVRFRVLRVFRGQSKGRVQRPRPTLCGSVCSVGSLSPRFHTLTLSHSHALTLSRFHLPHPCVPWATSDRSASIFALILRKYRSLCQANPSPARPSRNPSLRR